MHMWFVEALTHVIASKGEANPRPEPRDTSAREPAVCGVKHSHPAGSLELSCVLQSIKVNF
jgi:hypothetical protein